MKRKNSRPITKYDIFTAVIVCIMLSVATYIGFIYPIHPLLGGIRAIIVFSIITLLIATIVEKLFGIDKKRKKEIERKMKEKQQKMGSD